MFHIVEDAFVITRARGVYRQVKLYSRRGYLHAGHGTGYIRLTANGTSSPNVSWDEIGGLAARAYKPNKLGYLELV